MNDDQLEKSLDATGKGCFAKYFEEFSDNSNSREDLIKILMKEEGYEESDCDIRITQARRIIDAGRARDALLIIANSKSEPTSVSKCAIEQARKIQ